MTKRKSITITLKGPASLYYANMADDVKTAVKSSIQQADNYMPVLTDAHVIRYIIADYFFLKYGQEERKKIRKVFHAEEFAELEQQQELLKNKYA